VGGDHPIDKGGIWKEKGLRDVVGVSSKDSGEKRRKKSIFRTAFHKRQRKLEGKGNPLPASKANRAPYGSLKGKTLPTPRREPKTKKPCREKGSCRERRDLY